MRKLKQITGRKTSTPNESFVELYEHYYKYIDKDEVDQKFEEVARWIQEHAKGKKVAIGYSGGKDSIVLKHIMDRLGIPYTTIIGVYGTTYDYVVDYINEQVKGEKVFVDCGMSMEYLSNNPDKYFSKDPKVRQSVWRDGHQKQVKGYAQANGFGVLFLGRRKQENFIYKGGKTNFKGMEINLPISDWLHEELFGYLGYNNIPLPDYYLNHDEGFVGDAIFNWNTETGDSIEDCWDKVYEREPKAVIKAAKHIKSAQDFLNSKENDK